MTADGQGRVRLSPGDWIKLATGLVGMAGWQVTSDMMASARLSVIETQVTSMVKSIDALPTTHERLARVEGQAKELERRVGRLEDGN
jgi:hypothetical protein